MSEHEDHAADRRRVLLAEDDPVSRAFLGEGLRDLELDVHACGNGSDALAQAQASRFDLLLLDCRLPGRGAREILRALREDGDAASRESPVLVLSAEVTPGLRRELEALGCRAVLRKPLRLAELEQAVRLHAPAAPAHLVDDAAGLRASGSRENLASLRRLFAAELDALVRELPGMLDDAASLRERLHRLRSSCGFCGAPALGKACATLAAALDGNMPSREQALAQFRTLLADTRRALRDGGDAHAG